MGVTPEIQRVVAVLVRPTSYDGDGVGSGSARSTLPSQSLATLYSLTRQELTRVLPTTVESEIHVFDENVTCHAEQHEKLLERFPEEGSRLVVGMVAVEAAQFPRACDLIRKWQARGATWIMGGSHADGIITMTSNDVDDFRGIDVRRPHRMRRDRQELLDRGTVIIHGEAESLWGQKVADIVWWSRCLAWA